MSKRYGFFTSSILCILYILFGGGNALGIDVPEKLKEIPLYPGSTIEPVTGMINPATFLVATVKAESDAIAEFYKKTMVGKGWSVAFQAEQKNTTTMAFQKDKTTLQVNIEYDKGKNTATYSLLMTQD